MQNTDWERVQEIFNAAVELKGEDQKRYLESRCGETRELYNEVSSLLSADSLGEILPDSALNFDLYTRAPVLKADTKEMDNFETNENISLIGETIGGRYDIVRQLGSGGMGDVFLAHDRNVVNRETVIKLLKSETLANKEVVRKFKHEIEALSRLKDNGIVTILDSGTHGSQPFIVLEYVEGEDLALIISQVLFSRRDFCAPRQLAENLVKHESETSQAIWERLTAKAQSVLSGGQTDDLVADTLRDEFNRLLSNPDLFGTARAQEYPVPGKTTNVQNVEENPASKNRLAFEAAFPQEILSGSDKKLTSEEAARIFRQLGQSLAHGHEKGIIHRDLKPANIMVTQDGSGGWQTKLIDFGVAKVHESLVAPSTEIGLSFGTRKYMSPEQINSRPNLTAQTDIYALGLIAFESLTGQHIFKTDSFIEQIRMQEKEEFSEITEIRPDLSPRVRNVINKALSFDPANRHSSAAEFGDELADALLDSRQEPAHTIASPVILDETIASPAILNKTVASIPETPVEEKTAVLEGMNEFARAMAPEKIPSSRSNLVFAAAGLGVLIVILVGGWFVWQSFSTDDPVKTENTDSNTAAEVVKRELNYKLIVQKYYEGKPFQEPFEATGDEVFGDGWRFKMSLMSPEKGNLYLLAENQETQTLTMLFPHPQQNEGKSEIDAAGQIETSEMEFDKTQGTEKFWIVWASKPVDELEDVKSYVNPEDLGSIKDNSKEKAIRKFLEENMRVKPVEKVSDNKQSKTLTSTSDVLVKLAEFRHN